MADEVSVVEEENVVEGVEIVAEEVEIVVVEDADTQDINMRLRVKLMLLMSKRESLKSNSRMIK